jgi:hypothetical protein
METSKLNSNKRHQQQLSTTTLDERLENRSRMSKEGWEARDVTLGPYRSKLPSVLSPAR